MVKGDSVLNKYNKIWDKIKGKLNIKFHCMPVYDQTYIKYKTREFEAVIKTNIATIGIPTENMHCTCIACITIDSVMKIEKKNYPQVYWERCKYKVYKIQMSRFINAELDSNSDSDSESKSDTELMAGLEYRSDSK